MTTPPRFDLRLVASVFIVLVGCGSTPATDPAELQQLQTESIRHKNQGYRETLETILARMEFETESARPGEELVFDVLALHGGGPSGGFAAGLLAGWGEVEDSEHARPTFDLVTGASSGAVLAPLAFLGTDEAYEQALETALDPPFTFKEPGVFSLWPSRDGLISNQSLEAALRSLFTDGLITSLAEAAAVHRSLLIGATDLEIGLAEFWDLALEARSLPAGIAAERLPQIVLASAAVPPLLPPVEIDGRLYTDGGVAATMFTGFDALGVRAIAKRWSERQPNRRMPTIRIWIVINSTLLVEPDAVKRRYIDVAMRSIEIMMEYDRFKALLALGLLAEEMNAIDGVRAEFRWIAIPDGTVTPSDLADMQNQDMVRDLVELGRKLGADPESWNVGPPDFFVLPERDR